MCYYNKSEWVIKFNSLSGDSGQWGPYSPYKPCNHSLYIGIIIFPQIDNPQSSTRAILNAEIPLSCLDQYTIVTRNWRSGGRFNIKMSSYQYRKSHCGDKTILRPSYLHNGISYTDKMASLYWIRAQWSTRIPPPNKRGRDIDNIYSTYSNWLHIIQFFMQQNHLKKKIR